MTNPFIPLVQPTLEQQVAWLERTVNRGRAVGFWKLHDRAIAVAFGGAGEPVCVGETLTDALLKLYEWEHPPNG